MRENGELILRVGPYGVIVEDGTVASPLPRAINPGVALMRIHGRPFVAGKQVSFRALNFLFDDRGDTAEQMRAATQDYIRPSGCGNGTA